MVGRRNSRRPAFTASAASRWTLIPGGEAEHELLRIHSHAGEGTETEDEDAADMPAPAVSAYRDLLASAATRAARNAKGAIAAPSLIEVFVELAGIEPATS